MAPAKILVVDDDIAVRNLIHRFLSKQEDYVVEAAEDGKTALALFERLNPNLVILDVNLPDTTGYQLCQDMQRRTGVYIMMLTSRSDEDDVVRGFEKGADDYLTKPFSLVELGARVGAVLKRQRSLAPTPQNGIVFGDLLIDPGSREVTLGNDPILLTALEFDLLHFLARNPGRVWRRSELLQEVWDYDYVGDQRVVDVHIGQIRRKIEGDSNQPSMIQTVRGVGYKFEAPVKIQDNGS
ncbi:response regulator transcription factor [Phormidium yuhuli AB48]|uniref:Response regulator transcription factor n=1 Tax=Phormidium yuhuli AB48 TaxID=2940671 RepID=A0ABY5ASN7_9CYAN|nr:response regulator transcription factor [Phormidium yuhuli]USR92239.1 response regulator transcription factor [Phormidium yuhuli AB48]